MSDIEKASLDNKKKLISLVSLRFFTNRQFGRFFRASLSKNSRVLMRLTASWLLRTCRSGTIASKIRGRPKADGSPLKEEISPNSKEEKRKLGSKTFTRNADLKRY